MADFWRTWPTDTLDPARLVLLVYGSVGYESQGSSGTVRDGRLIEPERRVARQPRECSCRRGIFIGPEWRLQHPATRLCDPEGAHSPARTQSASRNVCLRQTGLRGDLARCPHAACTLRNVSGIPVLWRRVAGWHWGSFGLGMAQRSI